MLTLQPTSSYGVVPKARNTEFDVQACLYQLLKAQGWDVQGEVRWFDKTTREHCRFDIVMYRAGEPVHIVEVKARDVTHKRGVEATRQCKRYRRFGVPVTFVYGLDDAHMFAASMGSGE